MLQSRMLRVFCKNAQSSRLITSTPWRLEASQKSKKLENVDDLFSLKRYPVQALVEDPIIVKKFFVGEIDYDHLLFPEVLSKTELDQRIELNKNVSNLIKENAQFDEKGICKHIHDEMKRIGLYGYNIAKEFGGSGYCHTEMMLATEAESPNINVAMILNVHRLVCAALNEYGTNEQQTKYLPKLATGDLVATTAFQEWDKDDIAANRTIAKYNGEKKQWRMNGTKSFVINASNSNLFLVTALVPQSNKEDSLSIFLVDGDLPGVSVHKKDVTLGHTDLYQSSVSFKDVQLPEDALLSVPGSGRHIERTTQFLSRVLYAAVNLFQMKEITNYMLNKIDVEEQRLRMTNPEDVGFEASALRLHVSQASASSYAAESMIYMMAGFLDLYRNSNIDVETAIIKTFSQDALYAMAMNLSSFINEPATIEGHPINHLLRNAIQMQTIGEPKDILKLFIGVAGIQHCGNRIFDDVKKKRNPLMNPEYALRLFWTEENMDKYQSDMRIVEHVVSEFDLHARWLEASIQRLRVGVNNLMTHYGRNLLNHHNEIQRVSEAATLIYASFACIVRANRSWILRLPGAEQERILAGCCCDMFAKQVKHLLERSEDGPLILLQKNYHLIAKQLLKSKSYFPVHPLTRFL